MHFQTTKQNNLLFINQSKKLNAFVSILFTNFIDLWSFNIFAQLKSSATHIQTKQICKFQINLFYSFPSIIKRLEKQQKMEIPNSIKITMDPETNKLIDAYSKTKEEYANRVNIILLAKQSQVNLAIQKMHQQFLLILQKKVLTIQRKDDQIVSLSSALSQLKNQIYQAKKDIAQLTEQNKQLRREHTNLINEVKQLTNAYNEQRAKKDTKKKQLQSTKQKLNIAIQSLNESQREAKKFKQEYHHAKQTMEYLLKIQQQKLVSSYQKTIESLRLQKKEKYTTYEAKIKSQRRKLNEVQSSLKNLQEINEILKSKSQALNSQQKNFHSKAFVPFANWGTQTDNQKDKVFCNYGINVNLKCSKCQQLKKLLDKRGSSGENVEQAASDINKFENTSDMHTQTTVRQFEQRGLQTVHKYLQFDQEKLLQKLVRQLTSISKNQLGIQKSKYRQIESILIQNLNRGQNFGTKALSKLQREKSLNQKLLFQKQEQLKQSSQTIVYLLREIESLKQQNSHIQVKGQSITDNKSHYLKLRGSTFEVRLSHSNADVPLISKSKIGLFLKQSCTHNPFTCSKMQKNFGNKTISVFESTNGLEGSPSFIKSKVFNKQTEDNQRQHKQQEEDEYLNGNGIGEREHQKFIKTQSNITGQKLRGSYRKYSAIKRIKTSYQKTRAEI